MIFLVILGVAIAIVTIAFAFSNSMVVAISFGPWQFQESLTILILIILGLGILISLLFFLSIIIKTSWTNFKQKKQILALESQLKSRDEALLRQKRITQLITENNQELGQALSLNDRVTGFLNQDTIVALVSYLLQQLNNQSQNNRYKSVCLFLFAGEPTKAQDQSAFNMEDNTLVRAIAKRIKNAVDPDNFLGITNKKRFICLILNLKVPTASNYAEYIIRRITESPLQKADGTTMPWKLAIGGAISNPNDDIDSYHLLKRAENNLDTALKSPEKSIIISKTMINH